LSCGRIKKRQSPTLLYNVGWVWWLYIYYYDCDLRERERESVLFFLLLLSLVDISRILSRRVSSSLPTSPVDLPSPCRHRRLILQKKKKMK
jgi:hypothetical protein